MSLTILVVGVGYWGPNIVRNLLKISHVSVIACDLDEKKLKDIKKNFPQVQITNDYLEALKSDSLDVVVVATPVKSHYVLAKAALKANKHVFIEKPLTYSSKEAEELITLAKERKRVLMVGHTFVYSPSIRKIKQLIDKRVLGDIYYFDSTRINLGLVQPDSNVIWDLAPHDLSIIQYLFNSKPISLQAYGAAYIKNKHEELAHIHLELEKGITVHIHVSWLSPVKIRSILIGASKKMIVYDDVEPSEKLKIYDRGITLSKSDITPFAPAYRSGDVLIPRLDQEEALYMELKHLVYCVKNKKVPITDGYAGLEIVKLLEASDYSLKHHSKVIFHEK